MSENASDSFERAAVAFQSATGIIPPGKNGCLHDEITERAWLAWCAGFSYGQTAAKAENAELHQALFHVENGLSHPDESVRLLIEASHAARGGEEGADIGDEKCPACGADKMRRGPGFFECRVCTTRVPFDDMLACANEVDRLVDKLLADNARLREAIEAIGNLDLTIDRADSGPNVGKWEFLLPGDGMGWTGPFDTAADAALAGLAELGKDKTT